VNNSLKMLFTVRVRTVRYSARAREVSMEKTLSTVRLSKCQAIVSIYLQQTKSLTVQCC